MKKILFIPILFLAITFCQAQEAETYLNNVIKINPFLFGQSQFQLSYEHYFKNRKSSVLLMPSYLLKDSRDTELQGFEIMGQYRFYLTHYNKNERKTFLNMYNYGFYAGLYALYLNYDETFTRYTYNPITFENESNSYKKSIQSIEGGALLGLQMDISRRIVLDFYIGGGLRKSEVEDSYLDSNIEAEYYGEYSVFDFEFTGIKPKVGLMLGITF